MFCERIDEKTKQVFGLTSRKYDGYIEAGDIEQAYNGQWYLKGYAPEKPQEVKEQEVRAVRNSYLVKYVDPKQLVIVWNTLKDEEQVEYMDYRQYLLDYPETEDWYEQNPMTFEEWCGK